MSEQHALQFSRTSLAVAVSAACAAVPVAHAQDVGIEEIIVSATKREASIQDVPMAITAFSDSDIVREGFKQLEDYAGRVPALSFGTRHPGGSNVIMRGCSVSGIAFSDNPTTSVYLDEQPITVAGFNPDPRLIDIKRVEALSGPQGSLFGDASQCGTLRIITNKPDTDGFDGWVDLGAFGVAHGDVGYDVSAMVNLPLAENKAAIRLVGFYGEDAGYIDNVLGASPGRGQFPGGTFDNAAFVEDNVNTSTTTGGRASLRWLPTEDWTVDIGAIYQKLEEDGFGDTDLPEAFLEGRSLGEWEQMRYEEEDFEDEWYQLALTLEGSLGGADVVLATSLMNRESMFRTDATTYLGGWQERYPNKISDGGVYSIYDFFNQDPRAQVFEVTDTDRTSIELRVATPSDSDSRWSGIVGAFYNQVENHEHFASNVENLDQSGAGFYGAHYYLNYVAFYYNCGTGPTNRNDCIYPVAPSNNWWTGVYDNELKQMALFGEVSFDISDNFIITAGGRWFDIDVDRRLQQGTLLPGVSDYRTLGPESNCSGPIGAGGFRTSDHCYQDTLSSSSDSGFVPKVTLTYNLDDTKMFYGTYSEGFRRGGANAARVSSIFGRPPDANERDYRVFDSDLVKNFEIGMKTTLADGRVQFNLTAYQMIWEDIQVEAEDPTENVFTLGILNFPEAEITGLEAFFNWIPADGWNVTANLGLNKAELSKSGTLAVPGGNIDRTAEKGTRLPLAPDMKASLNIDRTLERSILGAEASWGIGVQHTGESVSSLSGIQSVEFDQPVRTQDPYTLVNLRFGLDADNWSATLYVNNATDEYAQLFYNDRWAQTRLSVNRPRTIGISYRRNFR